MLQLKKLDNVRIGTTEKKCFNKFFKWINRIGPFYVFWEAVPWNWGGIRQSFPIAVGIFRNNKSHVQFYS